MASLEHFFVLNFEKLLLFDFISILNFERDLNHRKTININHGDVASLAEGYCSVTTRASQFSSTTRNLVPRFKRQSKGERSGYDISNGPPRRS